jgi:hypothetical protein
MDFETMTYQEIRKFLEAKRNDADNNLQYANELKKQVNEFMKSRRDSTEKEIDDGQ